jgi:hypothetical protein
MDATRRSAPRCMEGFIMHEAHEAQQGVPEPLPSSLEIARGIESSVIYAAGYDRQQRRLYLRFATASYRYEKVPPEEWDAVLEASPKDAHVFSRFVHWYNSRRLSKLEADQLWGGVVQNGRPSWLEAVLQPPSAEQTFLL